MKTRYPKEFLYSLGSLLAAVIVVHAIWTAWVRPNAQAVLTVQAEGMRQDPNFVSERSLFVIMKDWEQETCVILMIWAMAIIVLKNRSTRREQEMLDGDPVQLRAVIELMQPQYLFCDHRRLPAARALPSGPWTWVAYEVTDAGQALELAARGVGMVESMAPLRLAGELAARGTLRA